MGDYEKEQGRLLRLFEEIGTDEEYDEGEIDTIEERFETTDTEQELDSDDDITDTPHFVGKDGTKWAKDCRPKNIRTRQHNIIKVLPGPKPTTKNLKSPLEIWSAFFTDDVLNNIVQHTNKKIQSLQDNHSRERDAKTTSLPEIKALLGLLYRVIGENGLLKWQDSPQPVFQVLLILISFVLSWGEAWFLDFRVIPQEIRASQVIISTPDTERTPLIRSYVQGLQSACTESVANFYSPQGSPTGSVHRFGEQSNRSTHLTAEQVKTYKKTAAKTSTEAWELLNDDNWKIIKLNIDDDVISSLTLPNENRKIYKISALINVKPRVLLDELFYRVENIPMWDSALIESRKLEIIDEHTDITYQISAKAAGGIVASRDFISLRIWNSNDKGFLIAVTGIDYPPLPETNKYIR
ncbi:steroidogenic acute regulatory protein-like [Holotrichia oblita]|uniref:Steroidogenic acute regulatory protein-like n=1 Tax=Holotrichia oblita TaxID=644536 RepID=A0ACB9TPU1_HOLOL|nr:steroidogenic acute regulatory protein-like [Holotrichia oblita]